MTEPHLRRLRRASGAVVNRSVRRVETRFVVLTALRWLPVGFIAPVVVLFASSRGLSAVEIGLMFSVQAVVVILLELPTGGLADTIGRRPVLVLSAGLNVLAFLILAAAQGLTAFALAFAVLGVARALDSGPVEAWFVDGVLQADADADTSRGLSRAGVATAGALASGAALGGVLPALLGDGLAVTFLLAAALTLVQSLLVLLWVASAAPTQHATSGLRFLRVGVREVPRVIKDSYRLARHDRELRVLVVLAAGTGAALNTMELIAPLRFASLYGSAAEASSPFGLVVALGFAGAAVGAGLSPLMRRLVGGSGPRAISSAFALTAVATAVFAVADTPYVLAAAYAASYLATGSSWPLRQQLLHTRVTAAQRTTTVSIASLALQFGGLITNQTAPWLFEAGVPGAAFGTSAVLLAVLALVSIRLPSGREAAPAANR